MRAADALALAALLAAGVAAAQSLPPVLDGVAARLPPEARARLLQRQQRLSAMTSPQRDALRAAIADWEALPEAERRRRRDAWQAWQALPADERARVRAARVRFDALPPDARQALRARFDVLDEHQRRGWLLGPDLGRDWPRLHALFAQVPADEQDASLVLLRALSAQARDDLAVLAQRTAPEQRDALRRELLALPMDAREGWLRARADPR